MSIKDDRKLNELLCNLLPSERIEILSKIKSLNLIEYIRVCNNCQNVYSTFHETKEDGDNYNRPICTNCSYQIEDPLPWLSNKIQGEMMK